MNGWKIHKERTVLLSQKSLHSIEYIDEELVCISYTKVLNMGKWSMDFMNEPAKTEEEFRIFGGTLTEMVTLSTIEGNGQKGKWRIA